jgi:hypothetical protein
MSGVVGHNICTSQVGWYGKGNGVDFSEGCLVRAEQWNGARHPCFQGNGREGIGHYGSQL